MLRDGVMTSEIRSDHTDRLCSMCSKTSLRARRAKEADPENETAIRSADTKK